MSMTSPSSFFIFNIIEKKKETIELSYKHSFKLTVLSLSRHFVNVFIALPFAIFKNSCNSGFIFVFRDATASSATILESHIAL